MSIKTVVFRVDASVIIGSGHVMRCLNLADRFRALGITVYFVCRDYPGNMVSIIELRGYQCLLMSFTDSLAYKNQTVSDDYVKWLWLTPDDDASDTIATIKEHHLEVDLLVVDHYGLNIEWERMLRTIISRLFIIDDLVREHDCEYLLDQNYRKNVQHNYICSVPDGCKLFLGPEYFLFSNDFLKQAGNLRIRTEIRKIFVFFGGADSQNYSLRVLELSRQFAGVEFNVVIGSANPNASLVREYCASHENCKVHYNIDYMSRLINECDLGICAGGVNAWERIFLRMPSLVYAIARNQEEICHELHQQKLINYMGTSVDLAELGSALEQLINGSYGDALQFLDKNSLQPINVVGEIL